MTVSKSEISQLMLFLLLSALVGSELSAAREVMSETTYKKVSRANEYIEEGDYDKAITLLDKLAHYRNNHYESAVIYQTLAYVYLSLSKYPKAIEQFEKSLSFKALPPEVDMKMTYSLIQLYVAVGAYQKALDNLELWLPKQENPPPEAYVLAANASINLGLHHKGIEFIKKAISLAPKPKEDWYRLWVAMHYELNEYAEAAQVLEIMIRLFPREKEYWKQLSSIYLNLKNDRKALATMELAYHQGHLVEADELKTLVDLYLLLNAPYKAAVVLNDSIRKGLVPENLKNWQLLSNAYLLAREIDPAINALKKAPDYTPEGKLDLQCAQLYLQQEDWNDAIVRLEKAYEKGGLKDPSRVFLLLGYAHYGKKDYQNAGKISKNRGAGEKLDSPYRNRYPGTP